MSAARDALESRRLALVGTIALQRLELRGQAASWRSLQSFGPTSGWQRPALIAAAAGAGWLLVRRGPIAGALQALRVAQLGVRCWSIARLAWRLAVPASASS